MKTWLLRGTCLALLSAGSWAIGADGPLFGPSPSQFPIPVVVPDEVVGTAAGSEVRPVLRPIPEIGSVSGSLMPGSLMPGSPVPDSEPLPLFAGCELFDCVRYKNPRKVAPCAVEMIVAVRTPCGCKKDPCKPCVNVKICVPPCNTCPKVKIRKQGDKVIYDYGKYAVELTSKRGEVVVAYHRSLF